MIHAKKMIESNWNWRSRDGSIKNLMNKTVTIGIIIVYNMHPYKKKTLFLEGRYVAYNIIPTATVLFVNFMPSTAIPLYCRIFHIGGRILVLCWEVVPISEVPSSHIPRLELSRARTPHWELAAYACWLPLPVYTWPVSMHISRKHMACSRCGW